MVDFNITPVTTPVYTPKENYANGLFNAAQDFLTFLIHSQSFESLPKIKGISQHLTELMCIASQSNMVSPQEEALVVEKLNWLKTKVEGRGLNVEKLTSDLKNIIDNNLSSKCKVIALLTQIEMQSDMPEIEKMQLKNKTISKLPHLSELEIAHLKRDLSGLINKG